LIVSYVELSDVISDYSEIYKSEMLKVFNLPSRASYDLNEGDLITSVSGNSIGTKRHASAIVSSKFHGSICSNGFRVFSDFSKKINKFYLIYYFKTNMFLDQIFRLRTGSAIPSIQDNDLLNIKIFVPSAKKISDISKVIEKGFKDREIYKNEILKI
jgi:type I restriction enzyme M protein